ncbi:glycine-rich domain-containing protein [Myroides sp. TSA_177.3]|uniref:glycine-rich domain-containing protein n=1 Tax=Myroides sp. TSA_177.3 TaxID=3415650 RepID=UPI004046671C
MKTSFPSPSPPEPVPLSASPVFSVILISPLSLSPLRSFLPTSASLKSSCLAISSFTSSFLAISGSVNFFVSFIDFTSSAGGGGGGGGTSSGGGGGGGGVLSGKFKFSISITLSNLSTLLFPKVPFAISINIGETNAKPNKAIPENNATVVTFGFSDLN